MCVCVCLRIPPWDALLAVAAISLRLRVACCGYVPETVLLCPPKGDETQKKSPRRGEHKSEEEDNRSGTWTDLAGLGGKGRRRPGSCQRRGHNRDRYLDGGKLEGPATIPSIIPELSRGVVRVHSIALLCSIILTTETATLFRSTFSNK